MTYIFSMITLLVIGVTVLMVGILTHGEPGQTIQESIAESIVWGVGFAVSFGGEFMLLTNI